MELTVNQLIRIVMVVFIIILFIGLWYFLGTTVYSFFGERPSEYENIPYFPMPVAPGVLESGLAPEDYEKIPEKSCEDCGATTVSTVTGELAGCLVEECDYISRQWTSFDWRVGCKYEDKKCVTIGLAGKVYEPEIPENWPGVSQ